MNAATLKIPDAERDVLICLNRLGQATVQEIRTGLAPVRELEASSVLTLLNRLEGKKLVTKRKAKTGKAFVFRPTAASKKAYSHFMKDLFHHVFGGDTLAFMSSFFETRKPSDSEIEQLKELLDELKAKNRSKSNTPGQRS
ncbi:MAG: BlaI/MecI/CopY family transcriptional regulator [Planctomycetota bacterium]